MDGWNELSNKYKHKFIFDKIDCTTSDICNTYNIDGVPTFIKKKDDNILSRSVGYKEISELEKFILE